jgi:hypothetical protein
MPLRGPVLQPGWHFRGYTPCALPPKDFFSHLAVLDPKSKSDATVIESFCPRSSLGRLGLQRWQPPIPPLVSVTTTVRCGAASGLWRTPHWLTSEWGFFARPCHRGGLLATDRNGFSSSSSFDESFNIWSTSLTAIVSAHSPLSS